MPIRHPFLEFKKVIRLPEYDYIGVTELELSIIDTYEFQRLRRIKQTPGAHMVYPGASHTRFEHSLGVAYLAGEAAISALSSELGHPERNSVNNYYSRWFEAKEEIQLIRLAALLHDIGHGPFSHTFEAFHQLVESEKEQWNHEKAGYEIIKKRLKDKLNIFTPDEIIILLKEKDPKNMFWHQEILTSPTYNVDRLNYLILDSRRAGTPEYGLIDANRLINNFYIHDDHLVISKRAMDAAIQSFEAYTHMYRSVYLHPKARATDLQIAYALYYAYQSGELDWIYNPSCEDLLSLWDGKLLALLEEVEDRRCKDLIDRYFKRDIFKCVYSMPIQRHALKLKKGIQGLKSDILRKIREIAIEDHHLVIDIMELKPPAPEPVDSDSLKRLQFYDEDSGELVPFESEKFKYVLELLTRSSELRVYTLKEFEKHVKTACKEIFGRNNEVVI